MQQIFRQWIGMHRAMIAWYHAAHHVTKGTGFGGDHVNIYGEIYTQLDQDLDQIVEKGIGLTGDETLADPVSSLSLAATKLAQYPAAANQSAEIIAQHAFALSKEYIDFLESTYRQFEACGMSLGLDDLLQGLANQYESYVYLLQQRSRTVSLQKESAFRMTESQLRNTIREALKIAPKPSFEDEGGGILPEFMDIFEQYSQEIIDCLLYWERWNGLTYEFLQARVKEALRNYGDIKNFDPDMFERALFELSGSGEIRRFYGRWNKMQDEGSKLRTPSYENRFLYVAVK